MGKVLDFDRFREESEKEYITVRVCGMEIQVRKAVPAIVPLLAARAARMADQSSRNQLYSRVIFDAADAMFGAETAAKLAEKLTTEEMSNLVQRTFNAINGEDDEEGPQELTDADSRSELPGDSAKK